MATTLELSTKRAIEEMGSGLEASKKAKAGTRGNYSDWPSFEELVHRYGKNIEDNWDEWDRYLEVLNERCKIREIQYYLISKGRVDEAKKIQSLEDDLACSIEASQEFRNKGWILRTDPGPYDDYQRLYVGYIPYYDDELTGQYCDLYFTCGNDLAFQKVFNELQSSITWDLSWSDAQRIREYASTKYKEHRPHVVGEAVQAALTLKKCEQNMKERVPLFTRLWEEVVTKERNAMEVLIEIKEKDVASLPSSKNIIEDNLRSKVNMGYAPLIDILDDIKTYINAATKGEYSDEELICRYFSLEGPLPVPDTYADYLEEKMQIAVNLGLTINESRQQQSSGISESC